MSTRKATVDPVIPARASARVAEIYADIMDTKGIDFVPNFWQCIATNPELLETVWSNLKRVMHPEPSGKSSRLDPLTRELIALAVSATNGCSYCVNSHTAAAQKHGMDQEMLGEVMAIVGLFNQTNAISDGFQIESDVFPVWEEE